MTVMDNTAARSGNAWVNTLIVLVCVALTAAVLGVIFRYLADHSWEIENWIDSQVYFWSDPQGYRRGKYKLAPNTTAAISFNNMLWYVYALRMHDWPVIGVVVAVVLRFFFPMSRRKTWRFTVQMFWLGLGVVSSCLTAPVAAIMFVAGGIVAAWMAPAMLIAMIGSGARYSNPDPAIVRSIFWGPLTMIDAVLIMVIPVAILLSAWAWLAWTFRKS